MTVQGVFRGLADATRREILMMLAEREMTIAEVADHFEITRSAVKKHLQVLEDGDLIKVRTEGRSRVSRFNPAALKQADDWMQFFNAYWDDRFGALGSALATHMQGNPMNDALTKTAFFPASPNLVWAFLTDKDLLATWYHPARENLVEGKGYELYQADDDSKARHVWGQVLRADPPRELVCTFEIPYFDAEPTEVTWKLEPLAGGTKVTLWHKGILAAAGEAGAQLFAALDKGWDEHLGAMRGAVQRKAA